MSAACAVATAAIVEANAAAAPRIIVPTIGAWKAKRGG
jgi:hypothetical protein